MMCIISRNSAAIGQQLCLRYVSDDLELMDLSVNRFHVVK